MDVLPDWPVDQDLVDVATASLQTHERFSALMRTRLQNNFAAKNAIEEGNNILDSLRHLKSRIEGTSFIFRPISLDHEQLILLKHLVIAHTPASLQDVTKTKIVENITLLLESQVKRVLYACLLTCPWFAYTQPEVSAQAKNNLLFVVYVAQDEQFFSLATPHEKELCETIDSPPLFACEVRHFCAQLQKGNVKCVEAISSPPESIIMSTPEWTKVIGLIDPVGLLHRSFVERCIGQAIGALVKKRPVSGKLVVRDDATLTKFCDSFRLLSYADSAIMKKPITAWRELGNNENDNEEEILTALRQAFEGLIHKEKLLQLVIAIKDRLEGHVDTVVKIPLWWSEQLAEWLTEVRMDGVKLLPSVDTTPTEETRLRALLDSEGLTSIHTRDIIVVARGGSQMYNLALPTSDTDYIIVYREPTEKIIGRCNSVKESVDTRGHQSDTETAAYEIRLFCEMLLKGAVNMFELLFAERVDYSSSYWQQLKDHKQLFMSEKVILQYIGFVKTHKKLIEGGKHSGTPRERKLFYQVFHKLLSLESFVKGGPPVVQCENEDREFILRVRNGPLEGELSKEKLHEEAEQRLQKVREHFLSREKRFKEFGDYRFLQTWLLHIRGIVLKEPLKMATPALTSEDIDI